MVEKLSGLKRATIRFVAQVIGGLAATRHATDYSKLFTKMMEIEKVKALGAHCFDFDAKNVCYSRHEGGVGVVAGKLAFTRCSHCSM